MGSSPGLPWRGFPCDSFGAGDIGLLGLGSETAIRTGPYVGCRPDPFRGFSGTLMSPQKTLVEIYGHPKPTGKPRRWRPAPTPWRRETPVARATWPASGLDVGDRDMVGPSLDLTSLNRCTALDREPTGVLRHRNDGVVELIHGLSWVATELGYQTCHGRGFQACPHRRGL